MNKRSEIVDLIDSQRPHILALTEFGAAESTPDGELGIEGYGLYRGNHSDGNGGLGRGTALYVANTLSHSACPLLDDVGFDCSAWTIIKLGRNKSLLVGVVYRSPKSTDENNQRLLAIMRMAATAGHTQLMLCGDYNLPLIDWHSWQGLEADKSFSSMFLYCVEELGLSQHVETSTRFRNSQSSCLDLVFTREEDMINSIKELPPPWQIRPHLSAMGVSCE